MVMIKALPSIYKTGFLRRRGNKSMIGFLHSVHMFVQQQPELPDLSLDDTAEFRHVGHVRVCVPINKIWGTCKHSCSNFQAGSFLLTEHMRVRVCFYLIGSFSSVNKTVRWMKYVQFIFHCYGGVSCLFIHTNKWKCPLSLSSLITI